MVSRVVLVKLPSTWRGKALPRIFHREQRQTAHTLIVRGRALATCVCPRGGPLVSSDAPAWNHRPGRINRATSLAEIARVPVAVIPL